MSITEVFSNLEAFSTPINLFIYLLAFCIVGFMLFDAIRVSKGHKG